MPAAFLFLFLLLFGFIGSVMISSSFIYKPLLSKKQQKAMSLYKEQWLNEKNTDSPKEV